jgi:hypothetical protein
MSRRFLYFAAIGLLVASAILGLPLLLERVVEAKLVERVDRQDVEVSWAALSWHLPATIELADVEFAAADERLRGHAERVEVTLPWNVAFADAPRVDELSVHSAELTIDLRSGESDSSDPTLSDADLGSDGDISEKLRRIGALNGTDITLNIVRRGTPLARLTVDEFAVSDRGESGRSIEATGEAEVVHAKLSRLPMPSVRWSATGTTSGTVDEGERELEVIVDAEHPERPLVKLALPRIGRVSAHRATVRAFLAPEVGVEVSLHDFTGALGSTKTPAVELSVSEVGLSLVRGANPRLSVTSPLLAVSPTRLARVRSLLAGKSTDKPGPKKAPSAKNTSGDSESRSNLVTRLSWWLQRLDASVSAARFDLRLDEEGEPSREITLVDSLDAALTSGELWARGTSAGGQVSVGAHLEPGMLLPRVLSIQANDVHLDDLPGIKEGRTLPNRGIRGRLGGVVDAEMMLVTEGEPLFGSGAMAPGPSTAVNIVTALAWKSGHVELSGLADDPLAGIDAGIEFELEWVPALAKISLRQGRATYGPMAVDLEAELVDWPFDPVFDLEARMDEIACQEAVRAFPKAMLGAYAGVEIDGEAAPTLRFHLPWHKPRELRLEVDGFVDKCQVTSLAAAKSAWPEVTFVEKAGSPRSSQGTRRTTKIDSDQVAEAPANKTSVNSVNSVVNFFSDTEPNPPSWPTPEKLRGVTFELPEPPKGHNPRELDDVVWLNRPFKKQVTEGVTDDAEVFVGPGVDSYVPMEELPPFVAGAAYLSEEMEFYENHGIDLGLIQKALRINFEGERFVYGGSTVTQQLVKNLFLSRDKTLSRKLKEALIAWRIEDAVPKWRVLELYLNCIEYAEDIYGIGPAAEYYFGKDARDLSPKEAVFIAILKPAPWYGDRFRRRGHTPTKHWWFTRIGEIMGRLVDKGYLTEAQAEAEKPYVLYWDEEGNYLPEGPDETAEIP